MAEVQSNVKNMCERKQALGTEGIHMRKLEVEST